MYPHFTQKLDEFVYCSSSSCFCTIFVLKDPRPFSFLLRAGSAAPSDRSYDLRNLGETMSSTNNESTTLDFHGGDIDSKTSLYYVGQGAMNSDSRQLKEEETSSTAIQDPTSSIVPWTNFFCCISVNSYQRYFDFDTNDIVERIKGSIVFANTPDHFREQIIGSRVDNQNQDMESSSTVTSNSIHKGPDLYAPIWITLTLVFLVALTSNATAYLHSDSVDDFEYDITHLANAVVLLFSFVMVLPTFFYFVLKFVGVNLLWADLVCLYGYSLVPYLPATFLCLLPYTFLEWILLLSATVISVLLILRNISSPLLRSSDSHARSYASAVLMAVMLFHLAFVLILKFGFYHHLRTSSSSSTSQSTSGGSVNPDKVDDATPDTPGTDKRYFW